MFKTKKKQSSVVINDLINATGQTLDELMSTGEGSETLLNRLGISRKQALEAVLADDEVESCLEDLRATMLAKPWRIYGDDLSDEDKDRLWKIVRKQIPFLAEIVITAKLCGYGVARYIYRQETDGFLTINNISDKRGETDRYYPKADGKLYDSEDVSETPLNTDVLYLLLTSRTSSNQPKGEMAAARIYAPCVLRKHGFNYAVQFVTRYAQPYLIAKINASTDQEHRSFLNKFITFISGGALTMNREDSVELLQNSATGDAFKLLENLANARIQKVLLGKVKTSDLATGSRAAQETEENTRSDRIGSYLDMLSNAVQHMLDAVLMVNETYGLTINAPKGVWFEFEQEAVVDVKRAERDKHYLDSGLLELTEAYFTDVLGFEPEHFKIRALPQQTEGINSVKASVKLASTQPQDTAESITATEQKILRPKINAIMQVLEDCENYNEFNERLNKLNLDDGDWVLIQKLLSDGSRYFADGLNGGNHHV